MRRGTSLYLRGINQHKEAAPESVERLVDSVTLRSSGVEDLKLHIPLSRTMSRDLWTLPWVSKQALNPVELPI